MPSSDSLWKLLFVLPNVELPDPVSDHEPDTEEQGRWLNGITLGSRYLAIVSSKDARVLSMANNVAAADKLTSSFRTSTGAPYRPAAIIASPDTPSRLWQDLATIVDFRNAAAFSFLLRARAAGAAGTAYAEPTWSDTFDLHPTVVSASNRLVTDSDALRALYTEDATYLATQSPHLSLCGDRLYPDHFLFRVLGSEWRRYYETGGQRSSRNRALFRSLQTAYQACSIATKNQGSLYEYGLQMALWVSAFEILVWPRSDHAGLEEVVELIGEYNWSDPQLAAASYTHTRRGQSLELNAAQQAYTLVYRARNRFLHGEPVDPQDLLPEAHRETVSHLPRLAGVLYRVALSQHLGPHYELSENEEPLDQLAHELFSDWEYERALLRAFGIE